jgi:SAM-dependent methyltransferase
VTGGPLTIEAPPASPAEGLWTWEQAVAWLRDQPDQQALVRDCYYDDPLLEAAKRFALSEEFRAVSAWLPAAPGRALDIGAGRGIGSFALARSGWRVSAVEPDRGDLVGAGAIRRLAGDGGVAIDVVEEPAEALPFSDGAFDVVYARQALHHAADLATLVKEAARVLRRGGRLIATREHVISRDEDLGAFLAAHPLHRFYGGEHAYRLDEYVDAIRAAGLTVSRVVGPFDSVVNYFPETCAQRRARCRRRLARLTGSALAGMLTDDRHVFGRAVCSNVAARLSRECDTPGRLFSFIADKKSP